MRTIRTLFALVALAIPAVLLGQVNLSISIGPPLLPIFEQPICPGDGYLWTPGYWAYDTSVSDYYWVDGAWVMAPEEGLLWTPGYWGWRDGGFFFNEGYWGQEVGFYGGIDYGFGYFGEGYGGGRWDRGHFFYNRSVNNVDISINRNVYNTPIERRSENRVSFNGGSGGIGVRATSQQESVARQRHVAPVAVQAEYARAARANPELRSAANHGNPPPATHAMPIGFNDRQPTALQHTVEPPVSAGRPVADPRPVVHPNDLAPITRSAPSNSGNAKADQKYQQQQDKLAAQQSQERQKLQQKQESQHQPNANAARAQQQEQKHSQQTQQQQQKHEAQQQSMQSRQPQAKPRNQ